MAEQQAVTALIEGRTPPSTTLRYFLDTAIKRALYSTGMTPEQAAKYIEEKQPLLDTMTSEDMALRVLMELPADQFVRC